MIPLSINIIVYFSAEEQVFKAETIQALDSVNSNYSFSSTVMLKIF